MLINITFYGALWWLLLFAPAHVRRLLRNRRGACPVCGYDLQSDLSRGCPECGWNRPAGAPDTGSMIFQHS